MADMAEGLIPPAWGFQARKVKSSSPGDHWPVACPAAHGVSGRYPQPPPQASHRPAAVGFQTPIERLQRRLGPPGRLPAGRGPVAPALRSR